MLTQTPTNKATPRLRHYARPGCTAPPLLPRRSDEVVRPRMIYWRVVLAAGGFAWVVVVGTIGLLYAANSSTAERKIEAAVTPQEEYAFAPEAVVDEKLGNKLESKEGPAEISTKKPAATEPTPSFTKAPTSPPLPANLQEKVVSEPLLPVSEQALHRSTDFDKFGTQVAFAGSPAEAAQLALKERKLLFVLHLSGNFEDAKLT
jgi:hypothetical protein